MSGSTSRNTRRHTSSEAIDAIVNGHYQAFDGRPVRDFVPVLVERATRADLEAGIDMSTPAEQRPRTPNA